MMKINNNIIMLWLIIFLASFQVIDIYSSGLPDHKDELISAGDLGKIIYVTGEIEIRQYRTDPTFWNDYVALKNGPILTFQETTKNINTGQIVDLKGELYIIPKRNWKEAPDYFTPALWAIKVKEIRVNNKSSRKITEFKLPNPNDYSNKSSRRSPPKRGR